MTASTTDDSDVNRTKILCGRQEKKLSSLSFVRTELGGTEEKKTFTQRNCVNGPLCYLPISKD